MAAVLARTGQLVAAGALAAGLIQAGLPLWTTCLALAGLVALGLIIAATGTAGLRRWAFFRVPTPLSSFFPPISSSITHFSVDAGGNWALADADGWHRFIPCRISRSPLGWITLQGNLHALRTDGRQVFARVTRRSRRTVVLWRDSMTAPAWRRLQVAATWTAQRQQGQVMAPSAADPRLRSHP